MNTLTPTENNLDFNRQSDKLFTNVFYQVRKAKTRFIVVYGGAGSSKSYSVHQLALLHIMQKGVGDTLVMRKYAADLRESCFKLFKLLIYQYGLQEHFVFN